MTAVVVEVCLLIHGAAACEPSTSNDDLSRVSIEQSSSSSASSPSFENEQFRLIHFQIMYKEHINVSAENALFSEHRSPPWELDDYHQDDSSSLIISLSLRVPLLRL